MESIASVTLSSNNKDFILSFVSTFLKTTSNQSFFLVSAHETVLTVDVQWVTGSWVWSHYSYYWGTVQCLEPEEFNQDFWPDNIRKEKPRNHRLGNGHCLLCLRCNFIVFSFFMKDHFVLQCVLLYCVLYPEVDEVRITNWHRRNNDKFRCSC